MKIVLIATGWGSGEGGINAFNYSLAIALAEIGRRTVQVYCALPQPTEELIRNAADFGVELIPVSSDSEGRPIEDCGSEIIAWLSDRTLGSPDLWIGHDIITGFAAALGARRSGRLALVHHMAYLDYHNATGGGGGRTLEKHGQQRTLFSDEQAIIFGVGPSLAAHALNIGSRSVCALTPGFPTPFTKNLSDSRSLRVIVAGRFDAASEPLKQSRLAVASLARAVKEAGHHLSSLSNPTMVILGLTEERIKTAELENLAHSIAGRRINIVPGPFDATPGRLIGEMASSNLAVMPSFHEGFGLVGWEAIGCEVPLILGRDTGLFKFIDDLLGGQGVGCLKPLLIRGGGDLVEHDVNLVTEAIIEVAKDLDRARRDAATLRSQLQMEKGCTWRHTALSLLREVARCGVQVPPAVLSVDALNSNSVIPVGVHTVFNAQPSNYFNECVELQVSAGQGSTSNHFDVIAEVRFGMTPLMVDDMSVEVFVRRASLRLASEGGRLRGDRLGEGRLRIPGVQALAGGVWSLTDPDGGGMLKGKILGDEVLCRIEAPIDTPARTRVEITASPVDLGCDILLPTGQELAVATRKIMEVFLKKAIFKESSGHIVLSEAELLEVRSNV